MNSHPAFPAQPDYPTGPPVMRDRAAVEAAKQRSRQMEASRLWSFVPTETAPANSALPRTLPSVGQTIAGEVRLPPDETGAFPSLECQFSQPTAHEYLLQLGGSPTNQERMNRAWEPLCLAAGVWTFPAVPHCSGDARRAQGLPFVVGVLADYSGDASHDARRTGIVHDAKGARSTRPEDAVPSTLAARGSETTPSTPPVLAPWHCERDDWSVHIEQSPHDPSARMTLCLDWPEGPGEFNAVFLVESYDGDNDLRWRHIAVVRPVWIGDPARPGSHRYEGWLPKLSANDVRLHCELSPLSARTLHLLDERSTAEFRLNAAAIRIPIEATPEGWRIRARYEMQRTALESAGVDWALLVAPRTRASTVNDGE